MIASLAGMLQVKALDHVVIDVGGVGYLVHVSLQTLAELPPEGSRTKLLCYTHVREDALQLYGFLNARERQCFELLKSVSGVGPKLALTILSGMPVTQLISAIAGSEHRRLQNIPGVGKKTAERLVVDLKDRFADLNDGHDGAATSEVASQGQGGLVDALVGLGYKKPAAERAVQHVARTAAPETPPELLLRQALAALQEL